jgi:hypothetical protein
MPNRIVIPQIAGQPIKLQITALDDADETTILTVVHGDANPSYAESFAHTRAGAIRPLGRDAVLGKADSGGGRRYRDGTFRQYVSEADQVVNAPGSSVDICYYDTPGLFPVQAPGGTTDQALLNRITALENKLAQALQEINLMRGTLISVDSRLDSISVAARG